MQRVYDDRDLEWVCGVIAGNSARLSRTRGGRSETATSPRKRPLLLDGEALRVRAEMNERAASAWMFARRGEGVPRSAGELSDAIIAIADRVNEGLLPEGRWRVWEIEAKVAADRVEEELARFCLEVQQRWAGGAEAIEVAARVEWELNAGRLHPFYDGCGRISRICSALVLIRSGLGLPRYGDRCEYYEHADQGWEALAEYMREGKSEG